MMPATRIKTEVQRSSWNDPALKTSSDVPMWTPGVRERERGRERGARERKREGEGGRVILVCGDVS